MPNNPRKMWFVHHICRYFRIDCLLVSAVARRMRGAWSLKVVYTHSNKCVYLLECMLQCACTGFKLHRVEDDESSMKINACSNKCTYTHAVAFDRVHLRKLSSTCTCTPTPCNILRMNFHGSHLFYWAPWSHANCGIRPGHHDKSELLLAHQENSAGILW